MRLPPLELDLRERTARAWKLDEVMKQMEIRQGDLASLGDRFASQVQSDSSIRLNLVVLILTIVQSVGVLAALVDFAEEGALRGPSLLRILLVVVASCLVTVSVLLATSLRRAPTPAKTKIGARIGRRKNRPRDRRAAP